MYDIIFAKKIISSGISDQWNKRIAQGSNNMLCTISIGSNVNKDKIVKYCLKTL